MTVISALPRIRERLWRERKEEYGYAFLLMEHHCLEVCDHRIGWIAVSTDSAQWFVNKFRYESDRLQRALCERHDRLTLGHAESAHVQSAVALYQLYLLKETTDLASPIGANAVDRLSDALIRIRGHMWTLLPKGEYGPRPAYSYATITTDPAL